MTISVLASLVALAVVPVQALEWWSLPPALVVVAVQPEKTGSQVVTSCQTIKVYRV